MAWSCKKCPFLLCTQPATQRECAMDVVNKLIDMVIYGYFMRSIARLLNTELAVVDFSHQDLFLSDVFEELIESRSISELLLNFSVRYSGSTILDKEIDHEKENEGRNVHLERISNFGKNTNQKLINNTEEVGFRVINGYEDHVNLKSSKNEIHCNKIGKVDTFNDTILEKDVKTLLSQIITNLAVDNELLDPSNVGGEKLILHEKLNFLNYKYPDIDLFDLSNDLVEEHSQDIFCNPKIKHQATMEKCEEIAKEQSSQNNNLRYDFENNHDSHQENLEKIGTNNLENYEDILSLNKLLINLIKINESITDGKEFLDRNSNSPKQGTINRKEIFRKENIIDMSGQLGESENMSATIKSDIHVTKSLNEEDLSNFKGSTPNFKKIIECPYKILLSNSTIQRSDHITDHFARSEHSEKYEIRTFLQEIINNVIGDSIYIYLIEKVVEFVIPIRLSYENMTISTKELETTINVNSYHEINEGKSPTTDCDQSKLKTFIEQDKPENLEAYFTCEKISETTIQSNELKLKEQESVEIKCLEGLKSRECKQLPQMSNEKTVYLNRENVGILTMPTNIKILYNEQYSPDKELNIVEREFKQLNCVFNGESKSSKKIFHEESATMDEDFIGNLLKSGLVEHTDQNVKFVSNRETFGFHQNIKERKSDDDEEILKNNNKDFKQTVREKLSNFRYLEDIKNSNISGTNVFTNDFQESFPNKDSGLDIFASIIIKTDNHRKKKNLISTINKKEEKQIIHNNLSPSVAGVMMYNGIVDDVKTFEITECQISENMIVNKSLSYINDMNKILDYFIERLFLENLSFFGELMDLLSCNIISDVMEKSANDNEHNFITNFELVLKKLVESSIVAKERSEEELYFGSNTIFPVKSSLLDESQECLSQSEVNSFIEMADSDKDFQEDLINEAAKKIFNSEKDTLIKESVLQISDSMVVSEYEDEAVTLRDSIDNVLNKKIMYSSVRELHTLVSKDICSEISCIAIKPNFCAPQRTLTTSLIFSSYHKKIFKSSNCIIFSFQSNENFPFHRLRSKRTAPSNSRVKEIYFNRHLVSQYSYPIMFEFIRKNSKIKITQIKGNQKIFLTIGNPSITTKQKTEICQTKLLTGPVKSLKLFPVLSSTMNYMTISTVWCLSGGICALSFVYIIFLLMGQANIQEHWT